MVEVVEPLIMFQIEPRSTEQAEDLDLSAQGKFPNDPMFDRQWNMRAMGAPAAWKSSKQGEGVIVAVIDTGVTQVEDLKNTKVLKGTSFVPGNRSAADDQGHGTHVAGTIAQSTNNGVGVAGVAPKATILPIKVLSASGSGASHWIASGVDQAVDDGAKVINLSLGGGYSLVIHNAIKKARKKGVVVVAAAGNSGRKGVGYPGGLKETIGVSAVGPTGELAPYSSWGKGVDIAAPGGDKTKHQGGILQDTVGPRGKGHLYAEFQGTSMATPHVAGAAAVLFSQGLNADEVEATLLRSARGQGWNPKTGHGSLDLAAALGATPTQSGDGWLRFVLGAALALMIARLSGASVRWNAATATTAAVTAGGLFFLSWLPVPSHWTVQVLTTGFLGLPQALGLGWLQGFPLWLSAGVPVAATFIGGALKPTRPLALGFAAGVAAHLFYGAATGTLTPWLLGGSLGTIWLVVNGTVCVIVAMGLAGTEKLDREAT
ncbi:MAG: serine protease [Kiritimatiellia bacterium]